MATFTNTFNFKSIGNDEALAKFLEDYDASAVERIRSQFEQVPNREKVLNWKRKPVTAEMQMPDAFASLPPSAQDVLKQFIADFVRSQYLDNFEEIGAHDWETIEKAIASSGRRGAVKLEIPAEVLKAMASSFAAFITSAKGNAKAGEALASLLLKKFTVNAFKRYVGEASDLAFDRVEAMLTQWAEWVAANDADNADDCAAVYEMATRCIARNRKTEIVSVMDILA